MHLLMKMRRASHYIKELFRRWRPNFNGTDQYVAITPWRPDCAMWSISCDVAPDVHKDYNTVLEDSSSVDSFKLYGRSSGIFDLQLGQGGLSNSVTFGVLDVGRSTAIGVVGSPDTLISFVNEVEISSTVPDVNVGQITAISGLTNSPFEGSISNVHLKSLHPMQGISVMAGNGTDRYASIPEITLAGDFEIELWCWFHGGTSYATVLGDSYITAYYFSIDEQELAVWVAGSVTKFPHFGRVVAGQKSFIKFILVGTDLEIVLDGTSLGVQTASPYTGANNFRLYGSNSLPYCANLTISHLKITDKETAVVRTYDNCGEVDVSGTSPQLTDSTVTKFGPELWHNPSPAGGDWTDDGDGTYTLNGSAGEFLGSAIPINDPTKMYEVRFTLVGVSVEGLRLTSGYHYSVANTDGTHAVVVKGLGSSGIGFRAATSGVTTGTISKISVRQIYSLVDPAGQQHGTWVNATQSDRKYLPRTDRFYPMNEGAGNVIRDKLQDSVVPDLWTYGDSGNVSVGNWSLISGSHYNTFIRVGKTYTVECTANIVEGSAYFEIGDTVSSRVYLANGHNRFTTVCGPENFIKFSSAGAGFVGSVTGASVKETTAGSIANFNQLMWQ